MLSFPHTVVIRHQQENLKKCSLRGLEKRADFIFISFPYKQLPILDNYIILTLEAPPLTSEDGAHGLLLLDATWRYAAKMLKKTRDIPNLLPRSLPEHYRTAYPRYQTDCPDAQRGLASLEAIYLSYLILGRKTEGLLDNYYWKDQFLNINKLVDCY